MLALHAYNKTKRTDPQRLERALFSIKQQAGVMAAICTAIFGVISALQSAKVISAPRDDGESATSLLGLKFGKRSSEREAA